MVSVTLNVDDELVEVLRELALMQNTTIEDVLRGMVVEDLQRINVLRIAPYDPFHEPDFDVQIA